MFLEYIEYMYSHNYDKIIVPNITHSALSHKQEIRN